MLEKSVKVILDSGLQARPAARFVQEANRFSANIFIEKNGKKVNAKSIMGLMSLAVARGEEITLITDGPDEEVAMNHLCSFVSAKEKA